jgi:HSP20 family protein
MTTQNITFNELFDVFSPSLRNMLNNVPIQQTRQPGNVLRFPIDIINEEKTIYVYAELPGVSKNDVEVDFFNNKLTISFEKNRAYNVPQTSEIKYGKFVRTLTLPICITRRETVTVSYKDGILRIKIDKLVEEENKFSVKVE